MRGQKVLRLEQGDQARRSGLRNKILGSRGVLPKSSPPILLSLTADSPKPMSNGDFPQQADKHTKPDDPKPPIVKTGSQGMDGATVWTTITSQTHGFGALIEIPPHIPMAP
jgi:hypothetical protein